MMTEFSQSELYEQTQSLYGTARQLYNEAMDTMCKRVPFNCLKSVGSRADREWLETLQKVAGELYDRVVSLRPTMESINAHGQELEALVPKFIGLRAKKVEDIAHEVREWATEVRVKLDETLRSADEWQLKADEWEKQLMRESPEERETRWMEEEYKLELAEAASSDVYDHIQWD